MQAAAKILLGLGAAAATVALASHSRHRAAIRGTTLLVSGAARNIDWKAARHWIERGAQLIVYTRTAGDLDRALRELRRLGPSATVQVDRAGEVVAVEAASAATTMGGLLGAAATVASVARWLWPILDHRSRLMDAQHTSSGEFPDANHLDAASPIDRRLLCERQSPESCKH